MKNKIPTLPRSIYSIIGMYLSYYQMMEIVKADPRIFLNFSHEMYDRQLFIRDAWDIYLGLPNNIKQKIPLVSIYDFATHYPSTNLLQFLKKNYVPADRQLSCAELYYISMALAKLLNVDGKIREDLPKFHKAVFSRLTYLMNIAPDSNTGALVTTLPILLNLGMVIIMMTDIYATFNKSTPDEYDDPLHGLRKIGLLVLAAVSLGVKFAILVLEELPDKNSPEIIELETEIKCFEPTNRGESEYKLVLESIYRELDKIDSEGFFIKNHDVHLWRFINLNQLLSSVCFLHTIIFLRFESYIFPIFHLDHTGVSFIGPRRLHKAFHALHFDLLSACELIFIFALRTFLYFTTTFEILQLEKQNQFISSFVRQYANCNEDYCPAEEYKFFVICLASALLANLAVNLYEGARTVEVQRPLTHLYQSAQRASVALSRTLRGAPPIFAPTRLEQSDAPRLSPGSNLRHLEEGKMKIV
jgi:hypothetical protein